MGSGVNDRRTPRDLFDRIDAVYHFTIDGAASHENALLDKYSTLDGTFLKLGRGWYVQSWQDGLAYPWTTSERPFTNPPYGRGLLEPFVRKHYLSMLTGVPVSVSLLPVRTEQPWFRDFVWDMARCQPRDGVSIEFLPARVKYDGLGAAPFPSMIVTWVA